MKTIKARCWDLNHFVVATVLFGVFVLGVIGGQGASVTKKLSLKTDEREGRLTVSFGGQKLLVYAFAANQFKPYVKEFYTLKGDNVLLDAPAPDVDPFAVGSVPSDGASFVARIGALPRVHRAPVAVLLRLTARAGQCVIPVPEQ